MSLTVKVERGLGDIQGKDITCSYFSSEMVFRQVGRVAIDKAEKGLKIVSITLPGMRPHIRPGLVIRLLDQGREYRAKVKSIQFKVGRSAEGQPYATCSMSLRMKEVL